MQCMYASLRLINLKLMTVLALYVSEGSKKGKERQRKRKKDFNRNNISQKYYRLKVNP